jgi:hypothetical protein
MRDGHPDQAAGRLDTLKACSLATGSISRTRHHREHEVSRLLPDRCRLHQMGQGPGHSGGAGPRFGRGLAGRLCADHHRCRSAALRPAVRALPQPRPRVDARLRHRLLPGPPRRGDPLRAGKYGREQVAQIITFGKLQARAVLRDVGRVLEMPYGQVDRICKLVPNNPANPTPLQQGDRGRAALCRGNARRSRRRACSISPRSSKASTATPRPTPPASSSATGRCPNWCRCTAIRAPTCRSPSST